MSGDVQPRKRRDKKKKKADELCIEEPRGTAAALGEGDVFMHSHHELGTGGHWCAKIIFFSLLAVLVTLIGLIILENRGLSELEANAVESRYSGVLEGWLEDNIDDDHHDTHTLELKHHENDDSLEEEHDQDDIQNSNEIGKDEDNEESAFEDTSIEQDIDEEDKVEKEDNYYFNFKDDSEDDIEENNYINPDDDISESNEDELNEENVDQIQNVYENESNQNSLEIDEDNNEEDEDEVDSEVDIEHIEREVSDEEPISVELPALPESDDDDNENDHDDDQLADQNENSEEDNEFEDEEDFLELNNNDEKPVEHITAPSGKPFDEIEETYPETSPDTLVEEDEYEKRQEELQREKEEQASHMWLKLVVGAALLVATQALVRRATAPRDEPESEENVTEEASVIARRMTLISEEPALTAITRQLIQETSPQKNQEEIITPIIQSSLRCKKNYDLELDEEYDDDGVILAPNESTEQKNKELYSDNEEVDDVEEVEQIIEHPKVTALTSSPIAKNTPEPEEISDDVEIIDEEQLEEDIEEEEDEEEISDVDDVELLSRLEAKYGRLPEPERPGQKYKDGGNSVEDEWPGEPTDPYWREQLDRAEHLLHEDWAN